MSRGLSNLLMMDPGLGELATEDQPGRPRVVTCPADVCWLEGVVHASLPASRTIRPYSQHLKRVWRSVAIVPQGACEFGGIPLLSGWNGGIAGQQLRSGTSSGAKGGRTWSGGLRHTRAPQRALALSAAPETAHVLWTDEGDERVEHARGADVGP